MESILINGTWKGELGRGLAPRELEFVLSAAQGLTAKQIAKTFGIAPGTVVKRLSNAMFKLGVQRQTAMVAEAIRRKIISPICGAFTSTMAIHTSTDNHLMCRERPVTGRRKDEFESPQKNEQMVFIA